MFCPRCGRPVSDAANFCGGCGLPRAEIEKYYKNKQQDTASSETVRQQPQQARPEESMHNEVQESTAYTNPVNAEAQESTVQTDPVYTDIQYNSNNSYSQAGQMYTEPVQEEKWHYSEDFGFEEKAVNENLSTVDYIWMLLISSIPLVGFIYLIYTAFFSNGNVNKRSFARAMLILTAFWVILAFTFSIGLIMSLG